MIAKEIMKKLSHTVTSDHTLQEANELMLQRGLNELVVVDKNEEFVGVLKDDDFIGEKVNVSHSLSSLNKIFGHTFHKQDIREIFSKVKKRKVYEIVRKNFQVIKSELNLTEVVEILLNSPRKILVVNENSRPVGTISSREIMRAFNQSYIQ